MSTAALSLKKQSDHLFKKKSSLLYFWDELAVNFFPERRGFTGTFSIGQDFAADITTSYPIIARRDLANSLDAMLRAGDWFSIITNHGIEDKDNSAKRWLENAAKTQRRAMYDRKAMFQRATREGSNDYTTFGQYVMSIELNLATNTLLYRTWHLKDVAWAENHMGDIDCIHRKWRPSARDLCYKFKDRVHAKVKTIEAKDPYAEISCEHIIVDIESYEDGKLLKPYMKMNPDERPKWASIYIDLDHDFIMEETPSFTRVYVIPRWQTVSGTPYAFSPAAIAALPDARLIQAMTLTLLEAGEKAVNPPMIVKSDAIRSDINLLAGGATTVDVDYDESTGEVIRYLTSDKSGLSFGLTLRNDIRNQIAEAFYLNKIMLPEITKEMTAYETKQRMEEYSRQALPIFQPAEAEENGAICEMTFELLKRGGAFGSPDDMPPSLSGAEVSFSFQSPLQEAAGQVMAQRFTAARGILVQVAQEDPGALAIFDTRTALREALAGITPASWLRDEKVVQQMDEQQAKKKEMQDMVGMIQQGAEAGKAVGEAGVALNESQIPVQA